MVKIRRGLSGKWKRCSGGQPSLYLAPGMTEKEEKQQRRVLMEQYGCSELDAAFRVADELDRKRGLPPREPG